MKRGEWLFPSLFLILLLVGYDLVPFPHGEKRSDSFAVDGGGKKAFFDLASRLLPDVDRNVGSLVPPDPDADTLVLLGPARYPDRAQWQTLHDWVAEGRALVFAAKWQDPAVELEPFGISVIPTLGDDEGEDEKRDSPSEEEESNAFPRGEDTRPVVETTLTSSDVDFRTHGQVRPTSTEAEVELSVDGIPQVIWQPVGRGAIVVVASDFVFSNLSMTKENNGLLAFRILESASPTGPVYFDEEMNQAGAPKVVGLLLEPPFRLPTLQLVLVTLLFGWMAGRRFGAVAHRSRVERRSLVEHAEALGTLHYKVGTGSSLVQSYLEHFGRELGLRYRTDGKRRTLEESRGSSEPVARALRAASSPNLERSRVGSVIAAVARLRAAGKGNPSAAASRSETAGPAPTGS